MRKKLCVLIEPSPASDCQDENSQPRRRRMECAADDIKAWDEYPWFIYEIPVARQINENPPKLYVEMFSDEQYMREAIEFLADVVRKYSLSICGHIVAPDDANIVI